MNTNALQVSQKAGQYPGLFSERDRPCLAMPETPALGINADLIHRLVHSAPVVSIQKVLNGLTSDEALLELAADYCGLFLVGTKHSASPYASLYLSPEEEPLLFGQQHQQMSEFLHQSKLQVQSHFPEPAGVRPAVPWFSAS
mgnify:CR=1 FL=1